jgi:hypothetical protein
MAWNGSGTFTRIGGSTAWGDDRDASVEIEAGLHDTHDEDLATAINACLAKNGENAATGDLSLGTNKLTGVGDPTNAQDAATKTYVDTRAPFASGVEILWRGGTAPTGWTITAINNESVRIVNTADTSAYPSGGSKDFTTVFTGAYTSASTAISEAQMPSHTHTTGTTLGGAGANVATGANIAFGATVTGSTGGGAGHTHTVALDISYQDFVIIKKT